MVRFYAGCYNSGELSSLLSGLEQLDESNNLALSSHALQLGLLFLNDWVFSQEPKTVRDVVSFLTTENNLRLILASRTSWEDGRLSLPEKSGRKELSARVRVAFAQTPEREMLSSLGQVLRLNMSFDERWALWEDVRAGGERGFAHASALGLFMDASGDHQAELISTYGDDARQIFIDSGAWDSLLPHDRIAAVNAAAMRLSEGTFIRRIGRITTSEEGLYNVYLMLSPYIYGFLHYGMGGEISFKDALSRIGVYEHSDAEEVANDKEGVFFDAITSVGRATRFSVEQWRTTLEPWSDFIEAFRRTWPESCRVYVLAAVAAGIRSKDVRALNFGNVLDSALPLVERARYARLKSAPKWWDEALSATKSDTDLFWVMTLLFSWASSAVIKSLSDDLIGKLESLEQEQWDTLLSAVRAVVAATREGRPSLSGLDEVVSEMKCGRMSVLLALRLPKALSQKLWVRMADEFDGKDRSLASYLAQQGMNEAHREPKMWRNLIAFLGRCGFDFLPLKDEPGLGIVSGIYYPHADDMPVNVAQSIADKPAKFPLSLLELAERSLSKRSGLTSTPLGDVAKEAAWFDG